MQAILTVGIPGCGKSTWAAREAARTGARVVELDQARAAINGDAGVQANIGEVVALRDQWIAEAAAERRDLIVADTNLDAHFRGLLIADLEAMGYTVHLMVFRVDHALSRERNAARDRRVPDHAMDRMIAAFDAEFGG